MTVDVEAIRARCEAATEGLWEVYDQALDEGWDYPSCAVRSLSDKDADWVSETIHTNEDAAFIAHARTDVPALLDALTASEAERQEAEAALRKAESEWKGQEQRAIDAEDTLHDVLEHVRSAEVALARLAQESGA